MTSSIRRIECGRSSTRISVTAHARDGRMVIGVRDEGSGLGLWIANAFIAANGGKMTAVSEGPGLGTMIAIDLPVTQAVVSQMESDADE